jgi:hypothetical protein
MKSNSIHVWLRIIIVFAVAFLFFAFINYKEYKPFIFLPGTQPGQADTAAHVSSCKPCHLQQVQEWEGSMMAHAPKDPFFNAMLSITSKYMMGRGLDVGEYCLRCHSPSGWLAGRSHPQTVKDMFGSDLDGVHCDFCHRMVDPLNNDGSAIINDSVPGYGNGMYATQRFSAPVRGARGTPHPCEESFVDPFYKSSEYCGVCHQVSNPYLTENARHISPHLQVTMERTYSEWKLSWFATRGEAGSCQSWHMKKKPGTGSSLPGTRPRLDIASHSFSGGNTFAPRSVHKRWSGVSSVAIEKGLEEAKQILSEAALLEVVAGREFDSVIAHVRVTNLTGHKLPTGFPEGRLLWLNVVGKNQSGQVVFESGRYDTTERKVIHDAQLKLYHTEPGISHTLAAQVGMTVGPSYLAALNDTVYLDNRIPPRGFSYAAFLEHRAEPVGYYYEDGQYWDDTRYSLPLTTQSVEVRLMYQVASKEFIEYVRAENINNPYDWNSWGEKTYEDWLEFGQPVEMKVQTIQVSGVRRELPPFEDVETPVELRLAQNYPNPFNPGTTIEFWISQPTFVSLTVFDVSGREVARLVSGEFASGLHSAYLNGSELASGIYFYRVSTSTNSITKKIILIK